MNRFPSPKNSPIERLVVCCLALAACGLTVAGADPQEVAVTTVVESNNAFALALYKYLGEIRPGQNLFFSPSSISSALAMTYAGARGRTAEEMVETLRWTLDGDGLHDAMGRLSASLDRQEPGCTVALANALWGQRGLPFEQAFLELTRRHYGAGLNVVDFHGATAQARRTINEWVAERTRDRIRELLQGGDVTPETELVLTNAIWFKGTWKTQFDPDRTHRARFRVDSETRVEVEMMRLAGQTFPYLAGDGFQALELPYAGENVSMVILLPDEDRSLSEVVSGLTSSELQQWLSRLHPVEMTSVEIPRFESTERFKLADVLRSMGMRSAFGTGADFSGILREGKLFIDQVIHEAFIKVDEEGTEAAAATAVTMKRISMPVQRVFRADRPFMFLIRDRATGTVLFLGRLQRP